MSKRFSLLVMIGFVSLVSITFFWAHSSEAGEFSNPGKMTAEERINSSKDDISQMKKEPEEKSEALISFETNKNGEEIKRIVNDVDVKIKQMYHFFEGKNKVHSGGYRLSETESLDVALLKYKEQTLSSANYQIKDKQEIKSMLQKEFKSNNASEKSLEIKKAITSVEGIIEDMKLQKEYVNNHGIEVYGVKVFGKNKAIVRLEQLPSVIAVEKVTEEKEKWNPLLPIGGNQ